ncbi:lipase 3-like [Nasonia vitripennis]|uniref:Partial AB-hydrolase lipase domain-containing protein n=1 Tax=Nasonia vitripennis TaxID=7425 RepID=A0A7M7QAM0_NASVI|nr:lipase 3-like [Nasonia vitripennis]
MHRHPVIQCNKMLQFSVLVLSFIITFTATIEDAAAVSKQIFAPSKLFDLDNVLKDFNLTALSEAIGAFHPHAHLNVEEVVRLYNYDIEIHTVQTSDEYILELHRINGNKDKPKADGKPVVFLQHGLLASSMDWVIAGPERGLGFLLSDAGYDVWMGNVRGSRYSRQHKHLTVKDPNYWAFSWHEIGLRDLPAMIDHVLKTTGRHKLFYVGHSQGSTIFYVMASELPEYNDKINVMFSLAPVAYCSRMFSPIFQALSRFTTPLNLITDLIGVYEFKPSDQFYKNFTTTYCEKHAVTQPLCKNVVFMITGYNEDQLDTELLPAILAHIPAGASVNQFVHYAQIIKSGHFRQFDYGLKGNLARYHKLVPPSYNLKNVKAPVSLHYSTNDWLSDAMCKFFRKDVEKLHSKLPNPIGKFRVVHEKFNHLDYLYAKDIKMLLYDKIMSIMTRYMD